MEAKGGHNMGPQSAVGVFLDARGLAGGADVLTGQPRSEHFGEFHHGPGDVPAAQDGQYCEELLGIGDAEPEGSGSVRKMETSSWVMRCRGRSAACCLLIPPLVPRRHRRWVLSGLLCPRCRALWRGAEPGVRSLNGLRSCCLPLVGHFGCVGVGIAVVAVRSQSRKAKIVWTWVAAHRLLSDPSA